MKRRLDWIALPLAGLLCLALTAESRAQVFANVEYSNISPQDPHPTYYYWNEEDYEPVLDPEPDTYYTWYYIGVVDPDARVPDEVEVKRIAVPRSQWLANRKWIIAKLTMFYQLANGLQSTALQDYIAPPEPETPTGEAGEPLLDDQLYTGEAGYPEAGFGPDGMPLAPTDPGALGNTPFPMAPGMTGMPGPGMPGMPAPGMTGMPGMPMPGMPFAGGPGFPGGPGMPGEMPGAPGALPGPGAAPTDGPGAISAPVMPAAPMGPAFPGGFGGFPGGFGGFPGGFGGYAGGYGGGARFDPQAAAEWTFFYDQLVLWQYYCARNLLDDRDDQLVENLTLEEPMTEQDDPMRRLATLKPDALNDPEAAGIGGFINSQTGDFYTQRQQQPAGSQQQLTDNEGNLLVRELFDPLATYQDPTILSRYRSQFLEARDQREQDLYKMFSAMLDDIDGREVNQELYEQWLEEKRQELIAYADSWRRVRDGEALVVDDTVFVVTEEPMEYPPANAVNISRGERVTPQDLLNLDGSVRQPQIR
ncbi:MAG TPA: hypothetical protein PLG73_11005 [Candidatus Sumerlaeota bacterium]|nr:hypothetical protein [Candidatus Sumerlaeota bacterium]